MFIILSDENIVSEVEKSERHKINEVSQWRYIKSVRERESESGSKAEFYIY